MPNFSWIAELLQRVPAHSFMAGLFVYFILSVIPAKEAWYWSQIEKQREQFFEARGAYELRKEAQLKIVEDQCYDNIKGVTTIGQSNHKLLEEIRGLINQKCGCER